MYNFALISPPPPNWSVNFGVIIKQQTNHTFLWSALFTLKKFLHKMSKILQWNQSTCGSLFHLSFENFMTIFLWSSRAFLVHEKMCSLERKCEILRTVQLLGFYSTPASIRGSFQHNQQIYILQAFKCSSKVSFFFSMIKFQENMAYIMLSKSSLINL